ncbi:hypothetical protein L207DRAFT_581116 [Hyaloscypha variabilis F]|uniref:FAD-binding FR-type domain-containing protein n=1 Tax=Hyaloscypha variabilis (strain UAMH 11265 / GT02V1 / F) TaxID=1149755 RepID=A0A2J6RVB2_HYAVF|nr:hypothetical protein L207DRAFT_581116 [Hyaloscypha variabilis F]
MAWPYHLLDLTDEQKHERRLLLDQYGVYAQLSAFIPILAYQLYRLAIWVSSERQRSKVNYSAIPSSPTLKRSRASTAGSFARSWRTTIWWLGGEFTQGWPSRGQSIAAGAWTSWLLFLCIHKTGEDYLHITKRFGVVAASQFPVHYMLSMKSQYSPLAFAFRSSHEQLNAWHRISGRIIHFFLICHAGWYINFFVQAGVVKKRLTDPVVIVGIVGFFLIDIIAVTSLERVRRWSYRVFFVLHLMIGLWLLPLLFFHAKPLRIYVIESLVLFLFDLICRNLDTVTGFATITPVPHTKLVKLKIPIPESKISRFQAKPGQHVYLSIPPASRPLFSSASWIHDFLFNPFTVAEVSDTDITLVLRALHGPTTKALSSLARLSKARPPIKIEGPLGCSQRFPNLAADYDRVLLVAGGVGSTFIIPIYLHAQEQLAAEGKSSNRVELIWSMRSAAEAIWAVDSEKENPIEEDKNVKIFLTRSNSDDHDHLDEPVPVDGSVELDELQWTEEPVKATGCRERPDLRKIVDETFRHGNEERVAVLVCGPKQMARELREQVGRWVEKGRDVYFHDESFGW